jgi:glycosyltransferase involved in cell wall biosynthesis
VGIVNDSHGAVSRTSRTADEDSLAITRGKPFPLHRPSHLRVLHVAQATETGIAHAIVDLMRRQRAEGVSVAVAAPIDGRLYRVAGDYDLPRFAWYARRQPGPSILSEAARLHFSVIRHFGPDVIHLHSAKAGLVGRLLLAGRVPTVFTPHAWSWLAVGGTYRRAAVKWEILAARWCDAIVCLSPEELDEAAAVGLTGALRLIPNEVDGSEVRSRVILDRKKQREALGVGPNVSLAVCSARLVPQKGQDVLLEAWESVERALPQAHLVLVGDGPERLALTRHAAGLERVHFAGMQERARSWCWLAASDVVVCPSRYEGMSLVPLEAAALGRPVVASDVHGMRPATENRRLVPPEQPEALATELIAALRNPSGDSVTKPLPQSNAEASAGDSSAAARTLHLYYEVMARRMGQDPVSVR